jgi:hypothetical protein
MKLKPSYFDKLLNNIFSEANLASDTQLLQDIEAELKEKSVPSDSPIANWFKTQFVKWYKSPSDDEQKSLRKHAYQEGEPEWMSKEGIMDFAGFGDDHKQQIAHMIDYFTTLESNELRTLYKEPYSVIMTKVKQWDEQMASQMKKNKRSALKEGTDFQVIDATKDANGRPMKWVRLLSKAAYKFEGDTMGHCVGGYNPASTKQMIFSLYDSYNMPHVTLEIKVSASKKQIVQIKGKQNAKPTDLYQPPCVEYIKHLVQAENYEVVGDGGNIGMAEYEGVFYFRDDPRWKEIYTTKIIPKQQSVFAELKKRISVVSEKFEYINNYVSVLTERYYTTPSKRNV